MYWVIQLVRGWRVDEDEANTTINIYINGAWQMADPRSRYFFTAHTMGYLFVQYVLNFFLFLSYSEIHTECISSILF